MVSASGQNPGCRHEDQAARVTQPGLTPSVGPLSTPGAAVAGGWGWGGRAIKKKAAGHWPLQVRLDRTLQSSKRKHSQPPALPVIPAEVPDL